MYKILVKPRWEKRFTEQNPKIRYHDHDEAMSRANWIVRTAFQVKIMAEDGTLGGWYEVRTLRNNANAGNGPA